MHLAEDFLDLAPVGNGLLKPLILVLGQGDTNGLTLDFAGPGISRTAPAGAPVLDIGTEDYIDRIVSTPSPTNSGYLFLIKGKRYIEHAPIITALNVSLYPESLSRTPRTPNDWTVWMSPQIT